MRGKKKAADIKSTRKIFRHACSAQAHQVLQI